LSRQRAFVADITGAQKRETAYGFFHFGFGLFWFLGSAFMGFLFDISPIYLALLSFLLQIGAFPFLVLVERKKLA
jgi:hypothetical protein